MRAGLAQVSALVPLVGPAAAFIVNRRDSRARSQAAKAFNGQIAAVVVMAIVLGPLVGVYFAMNPNFAFASFYGFPAAAAVIGLGWAVQAAIAAVSAFHGRDWTTPMSRVLHTQILPEGSQPSRAAPPER